MPIIIDDGTSNFQAKKSRKKKPNPKSWNNNIRKAKRQSGQEYVDTRGNVQQARCVHPNGCLNKNTCHLQCMNKISLEDRKVIHQSFWALDDGKKYHYYSKHVERFDSKRKRTKSEVSKKVFTYAYHLTINNMKLRVCREFFLKTLNINKGRILYYFSHIGKDSTEVPKSPWKGKHIKKEIPCALKDEVREHIRKFPVIDSHYCRANTSKQYLEKGLNLNQMYRLYIAEVEHPVKISIYRNIFDYEFNISFQKPKKDACEKCVAFDMSKCQEENVIHTQHIIKKQEAYNEREKDRLNKDISSGIICLICKMFFSSRSQMLLISFINENLVFLI